MERLKTFIMTTLLVSFLTLSSLAVRVVIYFVQNKEFFMLESWQVPAVILLGLLTAISTTCLLFTKDTERVRWNARIACHFVICGILVMVFGRLFGWYEGISGAVTMFVNYVIVYALVWIGNYFLIKKDERQINKALKDIRDEE